MSVLIQCGFCRASRILNDDAVATYCPECFKVYRAAAFKPLGVPEPAGMRHTIQRIQKTDHGTFELVLEDGSTIDGGTGVSMERLGEPWGRFDSLLTPTWATVTVTWPIQGIEVTT